MILEKGIRASNSIFKHGALTADRNEGNVSIGTQVLTAASMAGLIFL
jgi:hypothetical protein